MKICCWIFIKTQYRINFPYIKRNVCWKEIPCYHFFACSDCTFHFVWCTKDRRLTEQQKIGYFSNGLYFLSIFGSLIPMKDFTFLSYSLTQILQVIHIIAYWDSKILILLLVQLVLYYFTYCHQQHILQCHLDWIIWWRNEKENHLFYERINQLAHKNIVQINTINIISMSSNMAFGMQVRNKLSNNLEDEIRVLPYLTLILNFSFIPYCLVAVQHDVFCCSYDQWTPIQLGCINGPNRIFKYRLTNNFVCITCFCIFIFLHLASELLHKISKLTSCLTQQFWVRVKDSNVLAWPSQIVHLISRSKYEF